MPKELLRLDYSLNDIPAAATSFWNAAKDYRVMAFSGELGAGKTTFIHALCDQLGVTDSVSSPTFALINEYHFDKTGKDRVIYHMDWYRLNSTQEAINAGMEDCLQQDEVLCLIEWPEKAPELLRAPYLHVSISSTDETSRTITVAVYE
ncbi:MAG: tRNA (adenosine(37)-N6)-threonylcarbamoyltransferase complex ATPase subunit type 1 TsaE [Bacteroidetes bacterium]|nr:tRNA (adenosine(37)-N6)-threonylcarbamoyltransferase complex ATPase subunit type 1 TsaE [Bacteroidota bacterium]